MHYCTANYACICCKWQPNLKYIWLFTGQVSLFGGFFVSLHSFQGGASLIPRLNLLCPQHLLYSTRYNDLTDFTQFSDNDAPHSRTSSKKMYKMSTLNVLPQLPFIISLYLVEKGHR